MKNSTLVEALYKLQDCTLSSVEFVHDYVQFRFNGSTLTSYNWPILHLHGQVMRWGQNGYGDTLQSVVGSRLSGSFVKDDEISLEFKTGVRISISLRDEDYRGPEALELRLSTGGPWIVV